MEYRFNHRLSQVRPSEIRKFFELAQGKKDVINFGVGEPSFPTPRVICDAAKRALDEGYTHYSSNLGFMDLREAVAGKLARENRIPVSPDQIMITLGAAQALFIAFFALLNEGDEVIVLEPAFNVYASVVRFCGGNPIGVSLDEASGFHVDFDRLRRAVTERTRGIVVNSPHNPTGCVLREQEIHDIAALAMRHDLWVISDEVYEKIVYDGNRHISIASLPGMSERTITVNSFSKAFAMTGWRIGYLAAPTPIIEQLLKVHQNSVACANTIAQRAALAALEHSATIGEEMRAIYTRLRDAFLLGVRKIPTAVFQKPEGTFYAVVRTESTGRDSAALAAHLLESEGIVVVPGTGFGSSFVNFIRFSYCIPEDRIREGLARFSRGLARAPIGGR